ncbi:hypothetical protein ONE63_004240 [Megalurothrips usitatus]|uniref:Ribonuclease P/MRP protein subunit POP5 n=1 Tax=Megalurothrips usitatus TaxID=439358 RepID=A0AAV7X5J9_9NEOP|nr:hypothetical protein ONE63_004240 [Megalurothrips usitatus]
MVRFKNRYFIVEVNPLGQCGGKPLLLKGFELYLAVFGAVEKLHGDYGAAAVSSGFQAKYCNEYTRIAVLRSRHGPDRLIASTLPCVTHIGKTPVSLRTIYKGATLRHCFLFLQKYQRAALDKLRSKLRNDEERKALEAAVMDISVLETFRISKAQNDFRNSTVKNISK